MSVLTESSHILGFLAEWRRQRIPYYVQVLITIHSNNHHFADLRYSHPLLGARQRLLDLEAVQYPCVDNCAKQQG